MKAYAERTWGSWDGRADFDSEIDQVILLAGDQIGLFGVERKPDLWVLDKLYILPSHQNRGLGSYILRNLQHDAGAAQVALRLSVLEVNPAIRFYRRHGFVHTHTVPPRRYMEWVAG
jgi:ribosomal protein S18 acetylase RimI-like enzyme